VVDLFRQEGEIWFSSPDGVDGELPLAPALILYGPNDAGKSNTLRAITGLLRGGLLDPREPFAMVWSEKKRNQLQLPLDLRRKEHRELLFEVARRTNRSRHSRLIEPTFVAEDGRLAIADHTPTEWGTDERAEQLAESLHEALDELVDEESSETDEDVVEAFLRGCVLHLFGDSSSLWLERTLSPAADLADEAEGQKETQTVGLGLDASLPDLVEVVTDEDLERSIGDSAGLVDKVLKAATGWQRRPPWQPGMGWSVEWARESDDGEDTDWEYEDPWFDSGSGLPAEEVIDTCARLSEEATKLAPGFVKRSYRIEIRALEPKWWDFNGGARLRVALVPHDEKTDEGWAPGGYGLQAVGAGLRIWATFAVYEAVRRLADDHERTTLFVFDEPERHLHPTAQREAAKFIADIVRDGASVILATHAPAFLNERIPFSRLVRLERVKGTTHAIPFEPGLLSEIERHAAQLGLTRADLIQLTRGALLVEGAHDRIVVESFFGRQLADAGVRILVLRGADNAIALPDAELLHKLEIPLFLMLDNTSALHAELLNQGRRHTGGSKRPTKEERIHAAVAEAARFKGLPVTHVPLELPDIVWAIPEQAIREDLPDFPGWDQVTAAIRRRQGKIKDILRELYGVDVTAPVLGKWIATAREMGLEPDHRLKGAITGVIDAIESPGGPIT